MTLTAAFDNPVLESQACFRAVLDAMARPGSIHPAGHGLAAPPPLAPATASVLLTLVDADTTLWLAPEFAPAADWLRFHCGATLVDEIGAASFVLAAAMPPLTVLATGSDEEPESSTTVILQIPSLDSGRKLHISGPGLPKPTTFAAALPQDFAAAWADSHALYPRGIDLILCAGSRLAALPRSLQITEE